MENVLSKQYVKASQGHVMKQGQLMFRKVQALNHTKSRQMDLDKECCPPFLPIGSFKGQFGGMLRKNIRPYRRPSNPRYISSQNQARSIKAWLESSFHKGKQGCPHYTSRSKGQQLHSSNIVQTKCNFLLLKNSS